MIWCPTILGSRESVISGLCKWRVGVRAKLVRKQAAWSLLERKFENYY